MRQKQIGELRTDKLTNGDLLWKGTLGASLVLPAVVHCLTDPKELSEVKAKGSDERASEPPHSASRDGIRRASNDGDEDGEASGPYDSIEGGGYEVVRCDAVEPREVLGMVYVHEHAGNLHE